MCLGIQCEWLLKNISQNISSVYKMFVVWQQQTPGINLREKYNNDTSQYILPLVLIFNALPKITEK